MDILYIITQADGGGAQKYTLALAKHFRGAIAAGSEAQRLFDDAKNLQLTTYNLQHLKRDINPWHDFLAVWEIRQLIKALQPDIVHLNSSKAGVLGSFAAMGLKTKVVFTAHGFIFNEPLSWARRNFYLALEKMASITRNFIITVSEADKHSALKNNLADENKIKTIHNGLAPIKFLPREEARKELNLPLDKKITAVIANDYKTKGLDVLEQAMLINPVAGSFTAVLGKVPNNRQSNEHIKYLGYKENSSSYLKAFDGIIIPSVKEGFPFVVLEAMQAGQPIIATKVGGIPEALGDAGILIPANDPKALAEARKKILREDNLAKTLSQKALERSMEFTEEKMLEETKKIYELITNKK